MLACLSFMELLSHWYLTRFTDASYTRNMHSMEITISSLDHKHLTYRPQPLDTLVPSNSAIDQSRCFDSLLVITNSDCLAEAGSSSNREPGVNYIDHYSENDRKRLLECNNGAQINPVPVNNQGELWVVQRDSKATTALSNSQRNTWAWLNCATCELSIPPRCRHCPVCRKCILKRHHHCFFTGVCIGAANQRHFLAFMFWAMVVTVFGTAHMLSYTFGPLLATGQVCHWDLIPVVVLYRAILGYTDVLLFPLCVTFWIVIAFTVAAIIFFFRSIVLTVIGLTDVEYAKNVKIVDTRRIPERLRHVMGENWLLNFIVPYRRQTKLNEDAVGWPYMKRFSS